jgi:hypothetical protein
MERLERKRLQADYLNCLAEKQRATAVFEHIETRLCAALKCNRMTLKTTIEHHEKEGMDALVLMKVADFIKAGRELDQAKEKYQRAVDDRMKIAFRECCE